MGGQGDKKAAHEILGVPEDAGSLEVLRAYSRLAGKLHPKYRPNDELAVRRFKIIQDAYLEMDARIAARESEELYAVPPEEERIVYSTEDDSFHYPEKMKTAAERLAERVARYELILRVENLERGWSFYRADLTDARQRLGGQSRTAERLTSLCARFTADAAAMDKASAARQIRNPDQGSLFSLEQGDRLVEILADAIKVQDGQLCPSQKSYLYHLEADLIDRRARLGGAIKFLPTAMKKNNPSGPQILA